MASEIICAEQAPDILKDVEWAMRRYGYQNRQRFLSAVAQLGIPVIRINARVLRFDPAECKAWERSRSTGGAVH